MLGLGIARRRRRGGAVSVPYLTLPNYASIVTAGDSITSGVAPGTAGNFWPNLLASALGATLLNDGSSGTVVQNSFDSGGAPRSGNWRDSFATRDLGANRKAAIFVFYGFNDARYTGAPSTFNVSGYQNDLREVIDGLIVGGYALADIYIGSPPYISDAGLGSGSAGFTGQTRAGFETFVTAALAVAAEYGTRACDLYSFLRDAGFAATTTGDNIHPTDAGHAMIKAAWATRTYAANTRAAPASVSASVTGQQVTVTASAVSGAASYDYALIANPVDYAANTGGVFNAVAAGTYYARARAVFNDGSKGPWTFTASSSAVVSSTLNALTLSQTVFTIGSSASGTINGATAGSSISASGLPASITINGAARTFAYDGTGSAGTTSITLTETLAGYTNSPNGSTFNVTLSTVAAFVSDTFTDTAGTAITAHTPNTGGAWSEQPGLVVPAGTAPAISAAGRLYVPGSTAVFQNAATPAGANYYVEADLVYLSTVTGHTAGVAGRMQGASETNYFARYSTSAGGWQLYKIIANTATQLGTTQTSPSFTAGQTKRLRLTMTGTAIALSVDGAQIISVTDSSVTGAGKAGTRCVTATTSTTGIHLDNFVASA